MKRLFIIYLVLCVSITGYAQATDIVVDCQNPGCLSNMISYSDQLSVRNLKVTGYVNATDLKFIGTLISSRSLDGRLDLSNCNIVKDISEGDDNYLGSYLVPSESKSLRVLLIPKTVTKVEGCTGKYLYVDSVFFDCQMTTISQKCFGGKYTKLGHLEIGENVVEIPKEAFCRIPGTNSEVKLRSVHFPSSVTSIGDDAFSMSELEMCNFNDLINLTYLGRTIYNAAYNYRDYRTFGSCCPDTIIVPTKLEEYPLTAFFLNSDSHIFIGENTKTLTGGESARYTYKQSGEGITFHINQLTPPNITNWFQYSNWFESATVYVPKGAKSTYNSSGWSSTNIIEVNMYPLIISSSGDGNVTYSCTTIKNQTKSFTVEEGTSATISFTPDNGYRIASVRVNNTDVTSSVSNNQYTISNITANTTLSVTFEAIPLTSYTLSITASGNGSASYDVTTARNQTRTFTVNEGTSATVTFSPDSGYRIANVKVNNTDVTSSVINNQYTISNITANTTVEVTFEAIPPTTYSLNITASGNGSVSFNGTTIRSKTTSFTANEGTSVSISITPDNGYRVKSVKENNTDVTSYVSNGKYTINSISRDTNIEVEFEAIPPTSYSLSITASGNGSVTYNGTTIKNDTQSFTVNEGSSATVTFSPDSGYRIASVKVNNADVSSSVTNNQYTISSISTNTTLSVTFESINGDIFTSKTIEGIDMVFKVISESEKTCQVGRVDGIWEPQCNSIPVEYEGDITIPEDANGYHVIGIGRGAFSNCNIKSISIPSDVQYLYREAFSCCYNLQSVVLPKKKKKINGLAFNYCTSLMNIIIPSNVTFIGDDAFRACRQIDHVISEITNPFSISDDVFQDISSNAVLQIPKGTKSAYEKFSGWTKYFKEITEDGSSTISTYILSITASGNGSVSYNGTTIKNDTQSFTVNEGSSATVTFSPDNGYRIASVKVNNADVTSSVVNNQYTISNISANTTLEVEFEVINYTLSISATGNGTATYNNTEVRGSTRTFTVNQGMSATISFLPESGNSLNSVMVNGMDVTSQITSSRYTISNIRTNTTLEVTFIEDITSITVEGVSYKVVSQSDRTINLATGDYGQVLTVPASVTSNDKTWKIVGIEQDALKGNTELAAVIWNPSVAFNAEISNPNLLLYVKDGAYAPTTIQNIVVNNNAEKIVLTEAANGNNFYCPQAFTARQISYTHHYSMQTGVEESRGWETIALPFDVQTITHENKGNIKAFANWNHADAEKPFWLYELTGSGFVEASNIKANTPYIISMPNHPRYDSEWLLKGTVTFAASNVTVNKTEDVNKPTYSDRTFIPCFATKESDAGIYSLNVNNDFEKNTSGMTEGSKFVLNMRKVHPFEAYMTTTTASNRAIGIFDGMSTDIRTIENMDGQYENSYYDLQGRKTIAPTKKGVYIKNRKKVIIK